MPFLACCHWALENISALWSFWDTIWLGKAFQPCYVSSDCPCDSSCPYPIQNATYIVGRAHSKYIMSSGMSMTCNDPLRLHNRRSYGYCRIHTTSSRCQTPIHLVMSRQFAWPSPSLPLAWGCPVALRDYVKCGGSTTDSVVLSIPYISATDYVSGVISLFVPIDPDSPVIVLLWPVCLDSLGGRAGLRALSYLGWPCPPRPMSTVVRFMPSIAE